MLFYDKLVGDLEPYWFKINPYDTCVANKRLGRKNKTVCWHVNDLKISYVDGHKVSKMIR